MRERGIPAADIGGVDLQRLAAIDPAKAAEIARIDELMRYGKETEEEFLTLVRLMHTAGYSADAEYLLRRNIDCHGGRDLYQTLFGSEVPDEFQEAIQAFADEFDLELHPREELAFLVEIHDSIPLVRRTPRFNVLHHPCGIEFSYDRQDCITAIVTTAEAEQLEITSAYDLTQTIFLRWKEGVWRLIDWRDA